MADWYNSSFNFDGRSAKEVMEILENLKKLSEETAKYVAINMTKIEDELAKGGKGRSGIIDKCEADNERLTKLFNERKAIIENGEKWLKEQGVDLKTKISVDIDTAVAEQKLKFIQEAQEELKSKIESAKATFNAESVTAWANELISSGRSAEDVIEEIQKKMEEVEDESLRIGNLSTKFNKPEVQSVADESLKKDAEAYNALSEILSDLEAKMADVATIQMPSWATPATQTIEDSIGNIDKATEEVNNLDERIQHVGETMQNTEDKIVSAVETSASKLGEMASDENTDSNDTSERISELEALRARYQELNNQAMKIDFNDPDAEAKNAKIAEELDIVIQKMNQLQEVRQEIASTPAEVIQEKEVETTSLSLEELKQKLVEVQAEHRKMIEAKPVSSFTDEELIKLSRLQDEENKYASMIQDLASKKYAPREKEKDEGVEEEKRNLEETEKDIERLKQTIAEMRAEAQSGTVVDAKQTAQDIKEAEAELKRLEQVRDTIYGKQQKEEKPKQPAKTEKAINIPEVGEIDKLMKKALSKIGEEAFKGLKVVFADMGKLASIAGQGIVALGSALQRVASVAMNALGALGNLAKQGLTALYNATKKVGSSIVSLASREFGMFKGAIGGIVSAFNTLNSGARTVISSMSSLASKGFNALKSGVRSAISGIHTLGAKLKSLRKSSGNLLKSFTSIKSMLKRRVKRTFISAIFNQAKEGMQQLAKYDKSFNEAMSNIKNSAKQASGNLAVAMGNIVKMFAPAIEWLLNLLNMLFEKINAVFALLSGKSTVTTAKQSTDDYAKSLKEAGGAAKDLNKQLYGFDEITRQEDNSGSGGSKIEYEESDIGGILGGMQETIEKIKEAFENGEFEKVGELIAEELNKIIYKIDDFIVSIRAKAVEWSSNIARILNGLVSGWDAEATGKLFADGLNLILDVVNTFLTTFNFEAFGSKIADLFNGMFDNVEWDLLGKTVANYFNAFWRTLKGFVTNANWKKYGQSFATAFTNFFNTLDWDAITTSITEGVNGIVDTLLEFVTNVDWDKMSTTLFNNIKKVITKIDYNKIAKLLSTVINNAIKVATNLFDSNVISEFGASIGTTLGQTLRNIDWKALGRAVANGLSQITRAITNFIRNIDFANLGLKIADGIQSMFDNIDWEAREELITEGFNSVIAGLKNVITNVNWKQIANDFASSVSRIISGIKWKEIGSLFASGLNSILDIGSSLLDNHIISDLGKSIGSLLGEAFSQIDWSKLGETIALGLAEIQNAFTNFIEEIDLPTLGSNLAEGVQSLFDNIDWEAHEKLITTGIDGVVGCLSNFIDGVNWSENTRQFVEHVNSIIENIDWEKLAGVITDGFNTVLDAMLTAIKTFDFGALGKHIGTSIDTMLNGIDWKEVREILAGYINGVADLFYNIVNSVDWKTLATSITTELDTLVSGGEGGIDWTKIEGLLTTSIKALIDIFNTLVTSDTIVHLAENLGKTIGNVLSQIDFEELGHSVSIGIGKMVRAFKALITRIDFPNLAKKVGDGFNALFAPDENGKTIFDSAVELIETGLQTIVATFGTLADKILGSEVVDGQTVNLGSKIAEAINSLFANTGEEDSLFNQIGETIGNAISNVFKNILTFVTDTNFGDIAQGLFDMISSGIDNVFSGEDAGFNKGRARRFGESISKAISDVLSNATQFLEDVDFQGIGESIGSMLGSIDWIDIGKKFLKLLWAGLTGALSLIGGVASEFFKRIFGIADPDVVDATSLEWANQFADGLEDGLQNGEFKQRLASAATLVATGLGDDLIEANKQAESMYSGFAESVALSLNNVFQGLSESSDARIGLMSALGLDNADVELRNAMTRFLEDIKNFEGELTTEDILQGIYNNSESAEKLKEYFNSLGLDAPQALLDSLVGQRPRVNEASKHLLEDLQSAQNFEQVKEAWGAYGIEVTDEFAKSLVGIGNENLASALMLLGSGLDEATISALDNTHLSENLNAFMEENGTSIEETIGALLLASGHSLEEVSAILGKDAGYLLAMTLPEGMIKGINDGKQTVQEASDEFKAMAIMDDADAEEAKKSSENVATETTTGMSTELDNGKESVGTSAGNVVQTIDDKIKELPESEQANAKKMMEMMVEGILQGDPLVQSAIEKSATAVVEKVEKILSKGEGRRVVNEFLLGMKDSVNANFESMVSNPIVSDSGQIVTDVSTRLSKDNGKTLITWFMEGMADAIAEFDTIVTSPLLDSVDEIITALEDVDFKTIGHDAIYKLLEGMGSAISENFDSMVYSPISSYADGIATVLQNSASYSDGYSITFNILQGMYDAIANGNGQEVVNLFGQVIQALIDTAKQALGINSPSKVFAQIGEYTMQGMEVGLLESGEDAVGAVADVAKAMAEEGSGLSFSASIDDLSGGLDVATDKLSRIAEIFSGIADALTQMGGLNIPTIATGQTIPYRTQLGANPVANGASNAESLEDAIYSAFTRAIGGVDNDQGINITLMIDGRKMADVVTKYQRQQGRAVGV